MRTALTRTCRSRIGEVLYDRTIYTEFILVRRRFRGGGLGDQGFEDGVDDAVVPDGGLGVVVGGSGGEGGVACVVADLL